MLSAVVELRAPSEHSGHAQNGSDDGHLLAAGEYGCGYSQIFVVSSCLRRELKNTGVICRGQVLLLLRLVLNTQSLALPKSLLAFTGMNKHTHIQLVLKVWKSLRCHVSSPHLHLHSRS